MQNTVFYKQHIEGNQVTPFPLSDYLYKRVMTKKHVERKEGDECTEGGKLYYY